MIKSTFNPKMAGTLPEKEATPLIDIKKTKLGFLIRVLDPNSKMILKEKRLSLKTKGGELTWEDVSKIGSDLLKKFNG